MKSKLIVKCSWQGIYLKFCFCSKNTLKNYPANIDVLWEHKEAASTTYFVWPIQLLKGLF